MEEGLKIKFNNYMYYFIIGIASFVALVFLPMVGSSVGLAWALPTTVVGWVVWIAIKLIVAALNVLIFHCFIQQGKTNIKTHPKYIEAKGILEKCTKTEEIPLSPTKWTRNTYMKKGISIFFTTALSAFALSQAILTFDWVTMLTYLFTILMGLIFGVIQMKSTEEWWTDDYLKYALYIQKKQQEQEQDAAIAPQVRLTPTAYVENINTLLEEQQK